MKIYFVLLLITFILIHVSGCPSGWHLHDGMCFFFSRKPAISWAEASSYCKAFGFYLAETVTDDQVQFITTLLTKVPGNTRYYIGGSDIFVEGGWIWSSSQMKVKSQNWEPSEPNDNASGEDCLTVNHDGRWNDVPCNITLPFICETENTVQIG